MKIAVLVGLALACMVLATAVLVGVTSSAGVYDPWYDLDEDGVINIFDLVRVASSYGTTGNPGKNVTLVGRANRLVYSTNQTVGPGGYFVTGWISVDGYAKVTVSVATDAVQNSVVLTAAHPDGFVTGFGFGVDAQSNIPVYSVKTYDVPNQLIQLWFTNIDAATRRLWIDVYVVP